MAASTTALVAEGHIRLNVFQQLPVDVKQALRGDAT